MAGRQAGRQVKSAMADVVADLEARAGRHEQCAAAYREAIATLRAVTALDDGGVTRTVRRAKAHAAHARKDAALRAAQLSKLGDRVRTILAEADGPMRLADICELAKAPIWNVRKAIATLEAAHVVTRPSGGVKTTYALTGRSKVAKAS